MVWDAGRAGPARPAERPAAGPGRCVPVWPRPRPHAAPRPARGSEDPSPGCPCNRAHGGPGARPPPPAGPRPRRRRWPAERAPGRLGVRNAAEVLDQSQPQVRRFGGEDLHQGRDTGQGDVFPPAPVDLRRALILLFTKRRELLPEGGGAVVFASGLAGPGVRRRDCDLPGLAGLGTRRRDCDLQRLTDQADREGELPVALAAGPAGVAHGEGQAVQIGPVVAQGLQEPVGLLAVEEVDGGEHVGRVLRDLARREVLCGGGLEIQFRDGRQVVGGTTSVGRLDLRRRRQQVLQGGLGIDRDRGTLRLLH